MLHSLAWEFDGFDEVIAYQHVADDDRPFEVQLVVGKVLMWRRLVINKLRGEKWCIKEFDLFMSSLQGHLAAELCCASCERQAGY